jgi:hypothetical protein
MLVACAKYMPAPERINDEDLAVLRGLECGKQPGLRVISSELLRIPSATLPVEVSADVKAELEPWPRAGETSLRWPEVDLCSGVRIVSAEKISTTFAGDTRTPPGWEKFQAAFPDATGYSVLSLPAYFHDGRRTVVLAAWNCLECHATGIWFFLEKGAEGWAVVDALPGKLRAESQIGDSVIVARTTWVVGR